MHLAMWWVAGVVASLLILLPRWGYTGRWRHNLGSGFGIILIICVILILLTKI